MEAISKERVASVALVTARLSEDELAVYEAALSYALDTLDDAEIERRFGAAADELEGMRDDLREALAEPGKTAHAPQQPAEIA